MLVFGEEHIIPRAGMPQESLTPVGKCIYCLRDDVPLTDEHIIPDGIGGDLILPAASCEWCARRINVWEQRVQKRHFGIGRDAAGIRSRKRRGRKKRDAPLYKVMRGQRTPILQNPGPVITDPAELPELVMMEFTDGRATILRGRPASPDMRIAFFFKKPYNGTATVDSEIVGGDSMTMIAKIAHGLAVATVGLSSFRPFLTNLILNKGNDDLPTFIGTSEVRTESVLHRFKLSRDIAFSQPAMSRVPIVMPVITAQVQLFAHLGTPVYEVVVGAERTIPL